MNCSNNDEIFSGAICFGDVYISQTNWPLSFVVDFGEFQRTFTVFDWPMSTNGRLEQLEFALRTHWTYFVCFHFDSDRTKWSLLICSHSVWPRFNSEILITLVSISSNIVFRKLTPYSELQFRAITWSDKHEFIKDSNAICQVGGNAKKPGQSCQNDQHPTRLCLNRQG